MMSGSILLKCLRASARFKSSKIVVSDRFYAAENRRGPETGLVAVDFFREARDKTKNTYLEAVRIYKDREVHRRGHVEFIYSALRHMQDFGVENDLEVYKALIDVMPKGKFIPKNMFQIEFMHYPKQQQCIIDLLEQMEENGVIPDWDMEDQLVNVFGNKGFPLRRYWRMMYWMPKLKNISPWPLPRPVPNDVYELGMLAVERIMCVDINTEITTHKTSEVEESVDDTWIVSGQSRIQREILASLPDKTPVYVEGGFRIWLRNKAVTYFILRVNPPPDFKEEEEEDNYDDVSDLNVPKFPSLATIPSGCERRRGRSVHEQADGAILGVCVTGTSSKNSLLSWIRILQRTNPRLAQLPVLFPKSSPIGEITPVEMLEERNKQLSDPKT